MKKHLIRIMNMAVILAIATTLLYKLVHSPNFELKTYAVQLGLGIVILISLAINEIHQTFQNRAMKKMDQEMQEMREYRSSFLHNLHRDIQTPLEAIDRLASSGKSLTEKKDPEWDLFDRIWKAGKHTYGLLSNLNDLAALECGTISWNEDHFTPREILTEIIDFLYPDMEEKSLNLKVELEGNPDQTIIGDRSHVAQVFYNLIDNGVKYSRERHDLEVKLSVTPEKNGVNVTLSVRNAGVGFTDEFAEKLMTQNDPLNVSFDETTQGCGTGLAVTKSLLEKMNGELQITGKKNDHAFVSANLVCKADKENASVGDLKGLHVVVADGETESRGATKALLENAGASSVIDTGSLVEAVEIVMNEMEMGNKVDLVLFDRGIKDMDVLKAAQTLCDCLEDNAPKIIITAYRTRDIVDEAKEIGVTALVRKPFGIVQLGVGGR